MAFESLMGIVEKSKDVSVKAQVVDPVKEAAEKELAAKAYKAAQYDDESRLEADEAEKDKKKRKKKKKHQDGLYFFTNLCWLYALFALITQIWIFAAKLFM